MTRIQQRSGVSLLAILLLLASCERDQGSSSPPSLGSRLPNKSEVKESAFSSFEEATSYYLAAGGGEEISPQSTAISKAIYFPESQRKVLLVYFSSSPAKAYIFEGLPGNVWEDFKAAKSKGTYYNSQIRGRYQFRLRR